MKRGDTLSALARRHGTTVDAIMDANQGTIRNRDLIITGQEIQIPEAAKQAKAKAEDVQPKADEPAPAPQADAVEGAATVTQPVPTVAPTIAEPATEQVLYGLVAPTAPVAQQATYAPPQVAGIRGAGPVAAPREDNAYEQRVVELVNQIRGQYGLAQLSYDERLDRGAEAHTMHQAAVGQMAHEGIGDGTPQDRMFAAGWNLAWGENVGVGQLTPEQVVQEWMASPGHRANILNGDFRFLSVGYDVAADGRPYWTQSFGVAA